MDHFRPLREPARSIYDALVREASKRSERTVEEWLAAEPVAVLREASFQADKLGLKTPSMQDVERADEVDGPFQQWGCAGAWARQRSQRRKPPRRRTTFRFLVWFASLVSQTRGFIPVFSSNSCDSCAERVFSQLPPSSAPQALQPYARLSSHKSLLPQCAQRPVKFPTGSPFGLFRRRRSASSKGSAGRSGLKMLCCSRCIPA